MKDFDAVGMQIESFGTAADRERVTDAVFVCVWFVTLDYVDTWKVSEATN